MLVGAGEGEGEGPAAGAGLVVLAPKTLPELEFFFAPEETGDQPPDPNR